MICIYMGGIRRPEHWSNCWPGLCAEGIPDNFLHIGVDVGEPYLRYWGRRLRRWRWWPTVASLMRMDIGELGLRCRGCRLRLWKWRPVLAGLILSWSLWMDLPVVPALNLRRLNLGGPTLRCRSCRLHLCKCRAILTGLILNWPLWRDLPTVPAPSLRLEKQRWGRQMSPPVVLWLLVDVLPHRP